MPELNSSSFVLPSAVSTALDAKIALCTCAFASTVRRTAAGSDDRAGKTAALRQLTSTLSAQHESEPSSDRYNCPLLASHCQLLLLPLIEKRLCDDSESVRGASVDALLTSVPLLDAVGLCSLCLFGPLLSARAPVERSEDIRCGLLQVLQECCLSASSVTTALDCHGGAASSTLAAVCAMVAGRLSDSCPAVKLAAAECAALLPAAFSPDRSSLLSLSSVLSGLCGLLKQRLDVRKAALTAMTPLVPLVASMERANDQSATDGPAASPDAASSAGAAHRLSLPAIVRSPSSVAVLSSLCVDPKLSVRSVWFGCVSKWLMCGAWQRSDELWLMTDWLVLLDDDDAQLRAEALDGLTRLALMSDRSVTDWLAERFNELLPAVLRSLGGWKESERLLGCRSLLVLLTYTDRAATCAQLDSLLTPLCRCLLDEDRAVRDKARAALAAGADKWSVQSCIAAVQRISLSAQQQQHNGQSEMVTAALIALELLISRSSLTPVDNDALLAVLEPLLPEPALTRSSYHASSSSSSSSTDSPFFRLSPSSLVSLLSLTRSAAHSASSCPTPHHCFTAAVLPCQSCRLFAALHAIDCHLDTERSRSVDSGGGRTQWHELDELQAELDAVRRLVDSDSSLYVRCLPRLLSAVGLSASRVGSPHDERSVDSAAVPASLLLWLRRSGDAVLSQWRLVVSLWGGVVASRSSLETGRAQVVSCVAAFLSSPTHRSQLSSVQCADLLRCVLLPGCEWRPGAVNAVVRLHSLSCMQVVLAASASLPHSAGSGEQQHHQHQLQEQEQGRDSEGDADRAAECGHSLSARLLAALRSHLDDEQAACRSAAMLNVQAIAHSALGSHIAHMDGTTNTTHTHCSMVTKAELRAWCTLLKAAAIHVRNSSPRCLLWFAVCCSARCVRCDARCAESTGRLARRHSLVGGQYCLEPMYTASTVRVTRPISVAGGAVAAIVGFARC